MLLTPASRNIATRLSIFLSILLLLGSCRLTLLPPYEKELVQQIEIVEKKINKFYLEISEKTADKNGGRIFPNYVDRYISIETDLNLIYQKNRIRPLNQNSTRIAQITLEIWRKYKKEHRLKNHISDSEIMLNQTYLDNLFYIMQVAEKSKL